jgi:hypothetical protein
LSRRSRGSGATRGLGEDERIWQPDLNAVLDWGILWDAGISVDNDDPQATWWLQATPGVNYVRGQMPARELPGRAIQLEVRDLQQDKKGLYFPRQGGEAAVWLFPGNTTRALLMAEMKEQDYRVLVEVDDNYTQPFRLMEASHWLVKRDTSGKDRSSLETHQKIVKQIADGVIVSTPKLASIYSKLHRDVYVCPNSVAPEDWPEPEHQSDGVLRIGWAGSDSHLYDLNDIVMALDWASRQPDVEIVIMGGKRVKVPVPHRRLPWVESLADYRTNVGEIDVMLCPLRPGVWQDCKSDVKALEGAMGLAVPVVSKVEPYRPWWSSDAPCMVAERPKDFVKAVKHLVANREETKQLANAAREWVLENRSIERTIDTWRQAVDG